MDPAIWIFKKRILKMYNNPITSPSSGFFNFLIEFKTLLSMMNKPPGGRLNPSRGRPYPPEVTQTLPGVIQIVWGVTMHFLRIGEVWKELEKMKKMVPISAF